MDIYLARAANSGGGLGHGGEAGSVHYMRVVLDNPNQIGAAQVHDVNIHQSTADGI